MLITYYLSRNKFSESEMPSHALAMCHTQLFYYSCGLSTATIEYSCPSVCLGVRLFVCLRVCVCLCTR